MKSKKSLFNFYLIFSIALSIVFFILEKNHHCEGDGCIICLFSLIVHVTTNALLLIKFIPTIIEKIDLFVRLTYSNISKNAFEHKEKQSFQCVSNISEQNFDLVTIGVKIQ